MRLIATDVQRGRCVCVCLLSPTKADEPIVMPFGLWPRVGPMKHVLGVSRIPQKRGKFGSISRPIMKYRNIRRESVIR